MIPCPVHYLIAIQILQPQVQFFGGIIIYRVIFVNYERFHDVTTKDSVCHTLSSRCYYG